MKTLQWLLILALLNISTILNAQEYQILFTKQINGTDQLFTLNSKGELKQITKHPRKDSSPAISPNGNHIVFTSERVGWWKIWLMDLKKNEFIQLTNSSAAEYNPSWSPNGKRIVFVSGRSGKSDLYVINSNGRNLKKITQDKRSNTMSSWGSDGFIYYSTKVNGVYQIARLLPDGTKQDIITKDKGNKYAPQLSNDKTRILFYGDKDGNPEIYIYDISSKTTKRLTTHSLMDIRPKWSPDDSKIVFERGNKRNNQHIFIMDADGSNTKKLTTKNYNYAPSFVPLQFKIH